MADDLQFAYQAIHDHLVKIEHPVIFELGVCDGDHTQMLLSWCRRGHYDYYGFEPDPRNVKKVLNSWLPEWIRFLPDAVGHVTGRIPFHLSTPQPDGKTGSSSISDFMPVLTKTWPWLKVQETIEVQCWRLDDFCAKVNVDHIDFIWMDVQGAERLVFQGATEMLQRTRMIWTEYDGGSFYKDSSNIDDIRAFFPDWEVIADCGGDVLLRNRRLGS